MQIALFLNTAAGSGLTGAELHKIRTEFQRYNIQSKIFQIPAKKIQTYVRAVAQAEFEAIVVAGGDGTVSAVAGALVGTNKPLGVIPTGTFNHFAKDCHIPLQLEEAIKLIAHGTPQLIDTAEVNGHVFLNNSSVGLYPHAVSLQRRYLRSWGGHKWLAMIIAWLSTVSRFPTFTVTLTLNGEDMVRTTPFIFIGNNEYTLDLFNLGARTSFTKGQLSLYTANCRTRWCAVRFALRALSNHLHQETACDAYVVPAVVVTALKSRIRVAVDGEIMFLEPPLYYKMHPGSLWVIMPPVISHP